MTPWAKSTAKLWSIAQRARALWLKNLGSPTGFDISLKESRNQIYVYVALKFTPALDALLSKLPVNVVDRHFILRIPREELDQLLALLEQGSPPNLLAEWLIGKLKQDDLDWLAGDWEEEVLELLKDKLHDAMTYYLHLERMSKYGFDYSSFLAKPIAYLEAHPTKQATRPCRKIAVTLLCFLNLLIGLFILLSLIRGLAQLETRLRQDTQKIPPPTPPPPTFPVKLTAPPARAA